LAGKKPRFQSLLGLPPRRGRESGRARLKTHNPRMGSGTKEGEVTAEFI